MRIRPWLLSAPILAVCAAPVIAQVQPAAAAEPAPAVRLSDEDREAALEAGATRAANSLPINGIHRGVHGEVGMEIGSGGERALYGSALVPLGADGSAQISFLTGQTARWRGR